MWFGVRLLIDVDDTNVHALTRNSYLSGMGLKKMIGITTFLGRTGTHIAASDR